MEDAVDRRGSGNSVIRSPSGGKQETQLEPSRKPSSSKPESSKPDYSIDSLPSLENRPISPISPVPSNHNSVARPEPKGIYNLPPKFETLQKAESVVEVFDLSKGKN